jgi:hypothetical protein
VRFWSCSTKSLDPEHTTHVQFWRQHPHVPKNVQQLWVGAATKDIGLGIIRHNAQFTHAIDPDTNQERDFIIEELEAIGAVDNVQHVKAGSPYTLKNRVIGVTMIADGALRLVQLRRAYKRPKRKAELRKIRRERSGKRRS